jgi:hypothetical protein
MQFKLPKPSLRTLILTGLAVLLFGSAVVSALPEKTPAPQSVETPVPTESSTPELIPTALAVVEESPTPSPSPSPTPRSTAKATAKPKATPKPSEPPQANNKTDLPLKVSPQTVTIKYGKTSEPITVTTDTGRSIWPPMVSVEPAGVVRMNDSPWRRATSHTFTLTHASLYSYGTKPATIHANTGFDSTEGFYTYLGSMTVIILPPDAILSANTATLTITPGVENDIEIFADYSSAQSSPLREIRAYQPNGNSFCGYSLDGTELFLEEENWPERESWFLPCDPYSTTPEGDYRITLIGKFEDSNVTPFSLNVTIKIRN